MVEGVPSDKIGDFNSETAKESLGDAVVEHVMGNSRVKNQDWVIGVCGECHSTQSNSYMENSAFAQQGFPVPCQFCGGVVVITYGELQEQVVNTMDLMRGIGPNA